MSARATSPHSPRWIEFALALGLALAVLALYARVVGFEFIYCDDDVYVFQNPMVRKGLTWEGLRWALLQAHAANWHPLTWLSHMLDVDLFGLEAGRHHLMNAFFHGLNAALLFVLLRRATGRLWPAWLAAALFALHPLRVESVAWVAERKDVLSLFFALLTLLAYVAYARRPGWLRGLGVALLFALGLMAKPMLVTLPCVMLLLDLWPLQRFGRLERGEGSTRRAAPDEASTPRFAPASIGRLLLEKLPLLGLAAASSAITLVSQGEGGALGDLGTLPVLPRISNAIAAYGEYLATTFWPSDLAPFYPHPALVSPETYSPWNTATLLWALLLLALSALALWQWRRRPYLVVGWLWYLGTLVPVIGLVQVGDQGLADRYSYLPSIGIAIALVWLAADWARRAAWRQSLAACLAAGLLAVCAAASWVQIGYWHDGVTLFTRSVAVSPESYFGHNHLGRSYENIGEWEKARIHYQRAVDLRPSYAGAHSNLGSVLSRAKDYDEAIRHLEQAIALRPRRASFYSNLGLVYANKGDWERAYEFYRRAISIEPNYPTAHSNLGLALRAQGQFEEAAAELDRALGLDPDRLDISLALASLYVELGKFDAAKQVYANVLRLAPGHPLAICGLGRMAEQSGELASAEALYRETVRRHADCAWANSFFGRRQLARGEASAAILQFERLVELRRRDPDAHNDLGVAYMQRGWVKPAREQWETALALAPDHVEAKRNLARSLSEQASVRKAPAP